MTPIRIAPAILFVAGCATVTMPPRIEAPLALRAVQRPADVAERWGSYSLTPADSSGYTYEDDLLSLVVVPHEGTFGVQIENRSDHTIQLLWAESSYVGPSGLASNVVPGDTRWIDMGDVPGPQIIPARAAALFTAIPRANADTGEMEILPFYRAGMGCQEIVDSSLRLILALEVEGNANEYALEFTPKQDSVAIVTREMEEFTLRVTETARYPC